ncbi:kynurenine/alpha-aminoadipate aminotransferase, mitochondrial-like [Penaeus japonicus]|uniref:kynurenine/alpha-aminoadipate aminotransferase, mitochondrial-like n=1 Tax=Penaeus japonicus TaxID=27405 RepID=UPI001C71345A|nr:kynurenine/alpha-aminoadipate aminotransferase, mitochondrial-like [Penaeus japonicus]
MSQMKYDRFLNEISRRREPSLLRELFSLQVEAPEDAVFLMAGMPNPDTFPLVEGSLTLRDGRALTLSPKKMVDCLQYGPTPGYPPLLKQLKDLTQRLHEPPRWRDSDVVVTTGSQSGLFMAMEMMMSPNDYVLIEEPCYTGAISILAPYSPRYLPVNSDSEGMIPDSLKAALSRWRPKDAQDPLSDIPKFIYTIPTACNPTGAVTSEERRREIYKTACEYNLLILEDDPYYFLQFMDEEKFPSSYLRLDTEGRVLRFDSFSKIIASGLRVGWVTGPQPLIRKINLHKGASVISSASMSQVVVNELLEMWGDEGLRKHVREVRRFYHTQRDAMLLAAEKHLSGLCEWSVPAGGMFLWIKVGRISDTWSMVLERAMKKKVMVVPGQGFMTDSSSLCQYLRLSFSANTPLNMEKGLCGLAQLIREEIELQNSHQFLQKWG